MIDAPLVISAFTLDARTGHAQFPLAVIGDAQIVLGRPGTRVAPVIGAAHHAVGAGGQTLLAAEFTGAFLADIAGAAVGSLARGVCPAVTATMIAAAYFVLTLLIPAGGTCSAAIGAAVHFADLVRIAVGGYTLGVVGASMPTVIRTTDLPQPIMRSLRAALLALAGFADLVRIAIGNLTRIVLSTVVAAMLGGADAADPAGLSWSATVLAGTLFTDLIARSTRRNAFRVAYAVTPAIIIATNLSNGTAVARVGAQRTRDTTSHTGITDADPTIGVSGLTLGIGGTGSAAMVGPAHAIRFAARVGGATGDAHPGFANLVVVGTGRYTVSVVLAIAPTVSLTADLAQVTAVRLVDT